MTGARSSPAPSLSLGPASHCALPHHESIAWLARRPPGCLLAPGHSARSGRASPSCSCTRWRPQLRLGKLGKLGQAPPQPFPLGPLPVLVLLLPGCQVRMHLGAVNVDGRSGKPPDAQRQPVESGAAAASPGPRRLPPPLHEPYHTPCPSPLLPHCRVPTAAGSSSYFIFADTSQASAAAFCRRKGYSGGAGSVRTATLGSLGQGVAAINLSTRTLCTEATCLVRAPGCGVHGCLAVGSCAAGPGACQARPPHHACTLRLPSHALPSAGVHWRGVRASGPHALPGGRARQRGQLQQRAQQLGAQQLGRQQLG